MSERKNILITVKEPISKDIPKIGTVFAENADIQLVSEDSPYCVRVSVPAEKQEQIKADINEKGYIAENDYKLELFK